MSTKLYIRSDNKRYREADGGEIIAAAIEELNRIGLENVSKMIVIEMVAGAENLLKARELDEEISNED